MPYCDMSRICPIRGPIPTVARVDGVPRGAADIHNNVCIELRSIRVRALPPMLVRAGTQVPPGTSTSTVLV